VRAEIIPVEPVWVIPAEGALSEFTLNLPEPFSAIIFDCDGTLVDSNELHYQALNSVVGCKGVEMSRAWFVARIGFSQHEILHQFQHEFRVTLDPTQTTELFMSTYRQGLDTLQEIAVVANVARRYRGKVPMAVASGGAREIVRATLQATRLLDLFETIVTIEDVEGKGKPAPDLFLESARRLGVPANECMVFEDSDEGIEAARRAGMMATDVRSIYRPTWVASLQ
jgi:beta-phosphoglucomutase-like phosphatase (HAD superfamily)